MAWILLVAVKSHTKEKKISAFPRGARFKLRQRIALHSGRCAWLAPTSKSNSSGLWFSISHNSFLSFFLHLFFIFFFFSLFYYFICFLLYPRPFFFFSSLSIICAPNTSQCSFLSHGIFYRAPVPCLSCCVTWTTPGTSSGREIDLEIDVSFSLIHIRVAARRFSV